LALQEKYECFFLVADLHMLTTKPDKESILAIADHARAIVLDHLAIGIDPAKVTFYAAISHARDLRVATADQQPGDRGATATAAHDQGYGRRGRAGADSLQPAGLSCVLQAADILMPRAHLVPVGKDNESHVELTRQIARRFNNAYGEVFPLPDPYVVGGTLVGTDGQAKMSKSLDNAIFLSDDAKTRDRRVMGMYTDPNRVARMSRHVEGNPVFIYHDAFNPDKAEVEDLKERYREGRMGDVEVKEKLANTLNAFLEPMRERRAHYEAQTGFVDELLYDGTQPAREEARQTIIEVKKAMGLTGVWNKISRAAEKRRKRNE
jgi:tryptophanyl-tRNA synthetase